ncbi:MAG: hypothetical protein IJK35_02005, partial [Oscillospiraceae bacterium]|nr:hypothetical protein [Oscillospiraceae bacterium]
ILSGENSVKGFYENYPGIFVPENKTLTIQGDGSLTASSNSYGAGIGGGWEIACGNITIEGGTINAQGGRYAAGIGGGNGSCGNISITGGLVTANGGYQAAGIGSGGGDTTSCGDITIANTVTKVTATAGSDAPNSIGAGYQGSCGTVTIGGTKYWENNAAVNGGDTYLATSPLIYDPAAATGHALSAAAVGEIVGTDGLAYAAADKDNLPSGVTAAGLVAYKNGSNGLVIALADEASKMDWYNAMGESGAKAHTPAVTGQTWKLPSSDDIEKMLSSYDSYWPDLNEAIANVGGTGLLGGTENSYWLSDESDEVEDEARYMNDLSDEPKKVSKGETYLVRSVIAF